MRRCRLLLPGLLLIACVAAPRPQTGDALADRSRALRLEALDGEALFTVAGGLKPVSEGFWGTWVDVVTPDLAEVATTRTALAPWRNDELWADVHVMHHEHEGRRAARAYVVDRAALAELIDRERSFFAPYGLLPDTHPAEVLAVVERMPSLDRHRGQGLLFGYPAHAIDFFVAAAAERAPGEPPVPRRFVQIPTFARAEGRFVYAVPADQPDQPADVALRDHAARILARYRELRGERTTLGEAELAAVVRRLRAEFAALEPAPR